MIWESAYWKEDLLKQAIVLQRKISQRRWTERSLARIEQTIMLGFYSIRKLVEAHKISDEIVSRPIEMRVFPWTGKRVTYGNYHKISELYDLDLEKCEAVTRDLSFVYNQVIHSYVFNVLFDEHGCLDGILFNSDRTRHTGLYMIRLAKVIDLFNEVGLNDPASIISTFNREIGDYDVRVGPSLPPAIPGPAMDT